MKIGVDIEEISRFEAKSQEFLDRIFTKNEQNYCFSKPKPQSHLAVRFCAKEAVIKALNSMNLPHPRLGQIEVCHNENGCPKINLPQENIYSNLKIELSLSHDQTKAIAFVIIED